jgi:hypothetical protein
MNVKSNIAGIRLKLGSALDTQPTAQLPPYQIESGHLGARVLATEVAAYTVKVLLEGEMLDPASASEQLRNYGNRLENELSLGHGILHFLFPDEGRLSMIVHWLNSRANLHVWQMANRIPPPEAFYKAHPRILEACKLCRAVVLDASTPATITTASINPLTGAFLARWIQAELESGHAETRPRFFFHVVIPPRLWTGVMHAHFRYENGV